MSQAPSSGSAPTPHPVLRAREAVAITLGIVIGAGIFRTPSLVAGSAGSEAAVLAAWVLGGIISIVGALCYAELASAYPDAGGEYHYLTRAFGKRFGFLYAWARLAVIQTGSIALLAFVFGDYTSALFNLGAYSSALYAALLVVGLTTLHWIGVRAGTATQNWLTAIEIAGLLLLIVAGLIIAPDAPASEPPASSTSFGLIMVFVLLTFGGWNEAVYVSGELKDAPRRMAPVLVLSMLLITILYVLANAAYLRALGLGGLAASQTPAADVLRVAFGGTGATLISLFIAVAALTSANATLFTGARSSYAVGRDNSALAIFGRWHPGAGTPRNAVLLQGGASLLLVAVGAFTRDGFQLAVEYTAPVFWFFFLMVGVSLFVLRQREPDTPRPFRTPLYPLLPALFCATNAYLLYSSLAYTQTGALVGVAVLAVGGLLLIPFNVSAKETNS